MTRMLGTFAAAALLLSAPAATAPPSGAPTFTPIPEPASGASAQPHLTVSPEGRVWLSWIEQATGGARVLRMARLDGDRWQEPVEIVASDSLLGLGVDPPALLALSGVRFVALVPWKSGGGHARELRLIETVNGGATWRRPLVAHRDATPTEHGFTSLVPDSLGARAIWLDGRNSAEPDGKGGFKVHEEGVKDMILRTAVLGDGSQLVDERELDPRVCDCCPTAAVATPRGTLVAYRDRSAGEVRDIAVTRLANGRWSAPATVHADGWTIMGCPVNGPAIDARGRDVAVAWFSGAGDTARVLAGFSSDEGASFSAPVRVDLGKPIGRVATTLLGDGRALVVWLESGEKDVSVMARIVGRDGRTSPAAVAGSYVPGRGGGIPRLARSHDTIVLAWTELGQPSRVRTAFVRIAAP